MICLFYLHSRKAIFLFSYQLFFHLLPLSFLLNYFKSVTSWAKKKNKTKIKPYPLQIKSHKPTLANVILLIIFNFLLTPFLCESWLFFLLRFLLINSLRFLKKKKKKYCRNSVPDFEYLKDVLSIFPILADSYVENLH